jgi:HK97 gp10 family phage protein
MSRVTNREVRKMFRELDRLPYDACKVGQGVAQQKAPVASGELRNSIKVSSSGRGTDNVEAVLYTNKPYAAVVELGSATQPAQPYMTPAFTRISYYVTRTLNRL